MTQRPCGDGEFWFEEQIHREMDAGRHSYSLVEDVRLEQRVKEICRRARVRGEKPPRIKGDSLWRRIEEEGLLPGRTWQSMKERWKKHICPAIEERYQQLRAQGKIPAEQERAASERLSESGDSELTDETSDSESESEFEEALSAAAPARDGASPIPMDDDMWGIRAGPEILAIEDKFRVSKEADTRELAQLIQGVLLRPGDSLVLQGMGAHSVNCAVKATTIAAQRFGASMPLTVHFTGPAPGMIMNSQRRDYEIWLVVRLADSLLTPDLPEETRALIVSMSTRVHALAGAIVSSLKENTPVDLHGIGPVCVHKMAEALTVAAEFCRKEKLPGELLTRPSFYQVQSDSGYTRSGDSTISGINLRVRLEDAFEIDRSLT
ncbi:Lysophosphatidylcholine acyltransferase 2 [Perkinsus chesapeaki]|uniref:Lysophosphatidylcholine acyltransferase 2 n=1 Tax=Perkinsus chesapeaki TaxID=330153 RepID=A0A7J6MZX0_PERCH|nr:Lysophosphatidylcholine acyltransferase 2 [Perkinsus chesapeaki]